jgi:hypothetical protein
MTARAYTVRLMLQGQDQHPGRNPLVMLDLVDRPNHAGDRLDQVMTTMADDRGCTLTSEHYLEVTAQDGSQFHWYQGGGG